MPGAAENVARKIDRARLARSRGKPHGGARRHVGAHAKLGIEKPITVSSAVSSNTTASCGASALRFGVKTKRRA